MILSLRETQENDVCKEQKVITVSLSEFLFTSTTLFVGKYFDSAIRFKIKISEQCDYS